MIKFPDDFIESPHHFTGMGWEYRHAKQWIYIKPNGSKISIVGGCHGLMGDGVITFEMWDFDQEEPQGYLHTYDINEYLNKVDEETLIKPLGSLRFKVN